MRYRTLASTLVEISELGFGGMSLAGESPTSQINVIETAYEQGINYFDTADLYEKGHNEELVGKAVKPFRNHIILATKVGNQRRPDGTGWDWNPRKRYILNAVDESLRRLQTDYIDLYQLHGGTYSDNFEEIIEAFEQLIQAGKIKSYGISSIRPNVFTKYLEESAIVSNMMQYSLLDRRPEPYFAKFEQKKVGVIARGSMAQGLLIDKEAKHYLQYEITAVQNFQKKLVALSRELQVAPQTIALAYVLQHRAVNAALIGIRTVTQLTDLLSAYRDLEKVRNLDFTNLIDELGSIQYSEHLT